MILRIFCCTAAFAMLAGCGRSYSPDTYASNAVQQANKAEQGIVVGVREVAVSAAGTVGTVTGAAAGGIAGSQAMAGPVSAFTALGGSVLGGLAGNAAEHVVSDTKAFEYIVRKPSGDLVSVTQKDTVPLALGQKVLVIAGNQARVVPDYTIAIGSPATPKPATPETARPADDAAGKPAAPPVAKAADAPDTRPADTTAARPSDGSPRAAPGASPGVPADGATVVKVADPPPAKPTESAPPAAGSTPVKPLPPTGVVPALTGQAPTSP